MPLLYTKETNNIEIDKNRQCISIHLTVLQSCRLELATMGIKGGCLTPNAGAITP